MPPKVFNTLPALTGSLKEFTGLEVVTEGHGPADVAVLVRRTKGGGVDDPVPLIKNPRTTLVLAGRDTADGLNFAAAAAGAGVPEENIIILVDNQELYPEDVAERVRELVGLLELSNFSREEGEKKERQIPAGRVKVIAITEYRGGVGRTTVAASLARHLAAYAERVALFDLGSPPALKSHLTLSAMEQADGYSRWQTGFCDLYRPDYPTWRVACDLVAELVGRLRLEYRRVIVDLPAEIPPGLYEAVSPDLEITVVDSDIQQTVKPVLKKESLFIYNRESCEVPVELLASILGHEPVPLQTDEIGCQAALLSGVPAYDKSEAIAEGIGIVAALIDRKGGDMQ